jgi:hypothetical protein
MEGGGEVSLGHVERDLICSQDRAGHPPRIGLGPGSVVGDRAPDGERVSEIGVELRIFRVGLGGDRVPIK